MATIRGRFVITKLFNYFPKKTATFTATRCISKNSDERIEMLRELVKRKKAMGPEKIPHRSSFLEWNYKAELYAFSKRIGEEFVDGSLERALTQRSYVTKQEEIQKDLGLNDSKEYLVDNQSLAENGKDLTRDFVARYLRIALPSLPEEGILRLREHLLKEDNLANIISNIGADELILCTDFPTEKQTRVSTFYALVGAVEESKGKERGALFVRDFIIASLSGQDIQAIVTPENSYEMLTEIFMRGGKDAPEPRLISQNGVNTIIASYRVGLYSSRKHIGTGDGETVQMAVENAASSVLWRLWGLPDGKYVFPYNLDVATVLSYSQSNVPEAKWTMSKAN